MRSILLLCLMALVLNNLAAQMPAFGDDAVIYLVRHAEKETGNDPALTPAGNQRAGALLRELQDKKIQKIYTTPYRRTRQTADSLRLQFGIDTVQYKADTTGAGLFQAISDQQDLNKVLLVVGHSNTIPKLVRALAVQGFDAADLPDHAFDDLFEVRFNKGRATVKRMKYGERSPGGPGNNTMQ